MTTTSDPHHERYLDEADVRGELTRVFDICNGCRLCVDLCTSFPTLFEYIGRHDSHEAGMLTPAQQDQVVSECFQCTLCGVNCPYRPGLHEWAVDFPRLMQRATAMLHDTGQTSVRTRTTTAVLGRTDLLGRLGSATAPLANRVVGAKPASLVRKVLETAAGVSSVRLLPPFARERFTTWFRKRPSVGIADPQGRVAVFPTCLVEYQDPAIGRDLVKVYEHNGVECSVAETGCCGAPYLHNGDIDRFATIARKNVAVLAEHVRSGRHIVVPQATCGFVVRHDYVDHVGGDDASLVATHSHDAAEYLMALHGRSGSALDTNFTGDVPDRVTYHAPCHLRAQGVGLPSRDLIELTGATVSVVQQCSGIDGMWGLRAENTAISIPMAERLGGEITRVAGDVVAGDCHLANTAIAEQTGHRPVHPLQLVARAYGIRPEEER